MYVYAAYLKAPHRPVHKGCTHPGELHDIHLSHDTDWCSRGLHIKNEDRLLYLPFRGSGASLSSLVGYYPSAIRLPTMLAPPSPFGPSALFASFD